MKLPLLVIPLLLCATLVSAQEIMPLDPEIASSQDVAIAGITPDSPFWGIKLFGERFTEFFSEKAKLRHMEVRIAEIKVMLAKNKTEQAEKSRLKLDELYQRIEAKSLVQEQKALADNLGQKIKAYTAGTPGSMTPELREEVKTLIEEHQAEVQEEVQAAKNVTFTQPKVTEAPASNPYIGMVCSDGSKGHAECIAKIPMGQCINNKCEAPRVSKGTPYSYYCYSEYCVTAGSFGISSGGGQITITPTQ